MEKDIKFDPSKGKERTRIPKEQWPRQNLPILSETKAKRVYMKETVDETCWAYMKLLREHDRTKKIYSVDPYAEVYQFRENLYAISIESIDGMGDPWMYLINGPQRSMLIDTGFGLGNLKGLVEELNGGKEVIVVNTHSHFDHAYGNAQFEKVYCHEYEAPVIRRQNDRIWDYLFEEGTGRAIWSEIDRKDLISFKPYEVIGCPDGTVFDLGQGYEVELVFLGGHSAGHCGFLDKQGRNFFAGDDIISMRVGIMGAKPGEEHGECASVSTLRDNFRKLASRMDEFDHVFPGHFVTDLENSVVKNTLDACEAVCENPEENCSFKREERGKMRYYRYVEGMGTLCYTMDCV